MTFSWRMAWMGALLVALLPGISRAGTLAGSVNERAGIVYVEVEDEGKPATGVTVRLRETRKKEVVAQGRINAEGKWSWPLLQAGSYEVVIESREAGQSPQVFPVDYRGTVEADATKCAHCPPPPANPRSEEAGFFPWLPVGLGLGLLGSCGMVLWLSKFRGRDV